MIFIHAVDLLLSPRVSVFSPYNDGLPFLVLSFEYFHHVVFVITMIPASTLLVLISRHIVSSFCVVRCIILIPPCTRVLCPVFRDVLVLTCVYFFLLSPCAHFLNPGRDLCLEKTPRYFYLVPVCHIVEEPNREVETHEADEQEVHKAEFQKVDLMWIALEWQLLQAPAGGADHVQDTGR